MSQQDLFAPPPPPPEEVTRAGIAAARQVLANPSMANTIAERDAALAQVEANAPPEWVDEALAFLERYLETHDTVHVDDLWDAGLPRPPQPRALGAVMKKAAAKGWMAMTEQTRPSVSSHGIRKPVWRSLIRSRRPRQGESQ